jgi:hypothetical protein
MASQPAIEATGLEKSCGVHLGENTLSFTRWPLALLLSKPRVSLKPTTTWNAYRPGASSGRRLSIREFLRLISTGPER